MGIGRTFREAFWKAWRSREVDLSTPSPWKDLDQVPAGVHPWFKRELELLRTEGPPSGKRVYRRVDSCAGEVAAESNYYYSTFDEADEPPPVSGKPRVVIIGSGPNRIGQGIEFDYCCVHAAQSFRALGYEAVMLNCNPETVSTDYDTSDRLYFEPLAAEEVLAVCEREQPEGVVIQFGGQTPLKLARAIEAGGFRILGTPYDAVDLAEDRERFGELLSGLGIRCPDWGIASSGREAAELAHRIGYPVLVRPSYVLGGRAMRICYRGAEVVEAFHRELSGRVLVDRFIENAIEIDVDALCDGEQTYVAAVMQHVEEAGVHSGDSACVLPAPSLTATTAREVERIVRRLAPALGTVGLINVQLAVADSGEVYVLEANPRASRTVPFASKATGLNLVEAACRLAAGEKLHQLALPPERPPAQVSVKAAVLPFARFPGSDPVLGPEMRSTGEVMASATDLPTAFAKAERAAGRPLPTSGTAFFSVRDADKPAVVPVAAALAGLGFKLLATDGTARTLQAAGLEVDRVAKVAEGTEEASVVDLIRRGRCDLVVNTPFGGSLQRTDGYRIREAALVARVPCITTISGAAAAVHAIANARTELALSLQERIDVETRTANGH
ncbi:MAG TPA: carbamoyl-phosphate synthase large subunit, partial [Gaiellaceae bacterium]|nr:carbamoyl-phosphate synthase large subunit [Gaiellaceae bacterium]